ncbi:MAG: glycosyltransferase family 9 protein [Gemmatimonadota bacterium]|nr:glycosyltransferase family 9 protein [Gemmatimonadota bacterium]
MHTHKTKRLLSLNLHGLGDFIISLPVLNEIARSHLVESVTSLVWPALEEIASCAPAIDRVLPLPRALENQPELGDFIRAASGPDGFDIVLDFSFLPRSAWIAETACAGRTIGFGIDLEKYGPSGYTDSIPNLDGELRIHRNLQVLETLGLPFSGGLDFSVNIPVPMAREVESLLEAQGLDLRTCRPIALHPGSGVRSRNWAPERFAGLADRLAAHLDEPVLLLGGKERTYDGTNEKTLAGEVEQAMQHSAFNLAGQLSLPQIASLLSHCSLFVGNNSGPAHLAASVTNVPCLLIWAPRNEKLWRPVGAPVELVTAEPDCSRRCSLNQCDHLQHCLDRITVDEAFERFIQGLAPALPLVSSGGRT